MSFSGGSLSWGYMDRRFSRHSYSFCSLCVNEVYVAGSVTGALFTVLQELRTRRFSCRTGFGGLKFICARFD